MIHFICLANLHVCYMCSSNALLVELFFGGHSILLSEASVGFSHGIGLATDIIYSDFIPLGLEHMTETPGMSLI